MGKAIVRRSEVRFFLAHAHAVRGFTVGPDLTTRIETGPISRSAPRIDRTAFMGVQRLRLNHYLLQSRARFKRVQSTRLGSVSGIRKKGKPFKTLSYFEDIDPSLSETLDTALARKHTRMRRAGSGAFGSSASGSGASGSSRGGHWPGVSFLGSTAVGNRASAPASTLDVPPPPHRTADAVLWALGGASEQARRELLVSLASAVANGQERSADSECWYSTPSLRDLPSPHCKLSPPLAYLIALSNASLTCEDVLGALVQGTRTLPCSWLRLPPSAASRAVSPGCEAEAPFLLTAGVYLLSIETAHLHHPSFAAFARNAAAGAHVNRTDIASGSSAMANNFRFVVDKLALAIGLRRVLYLDTDTSITGSLLPLFHLAHTHAEVPLIVAKRSHHGLRASWNPWNLATEHVLAVLRDRYGFDASARQQFNAGMLLINTRAYCKADVFGRMMAVAHLHAHARPLFLTLGGLNQPFAEVAAAQLTHQVGVEWNCRKSDKGCALSEVSPARILHARGYGIERCVTFFTSRKRSQAVGKILTNVDLQRCIAWGRAGTFPRWLTNQMARMRTP